MLVVAGLAIVAAAAGAVYFGAGAAADAAGARGMAHHADLRYDQALDDYTRASRLNPQDWRWAYYRGLVHADRGDAARAADAFRAVVEAQPGMAIAWWRLGDAEFKQARFDAADAAYARAETDSAIVEHARRGRARIARRHAPGGDRYVPPRDGMIDALADISRSSVFLLRYAASLDLAREPARREAVVRRALAVDPENPDVVYEVGSLLQQLRKPGEALPFFTRHLDMVEDDQQTLVQIGKCHIDMGRLDEAETSLRRALAEGDDAVGLYNLGIVLEQTGRAEEAERSYRRAIALGPGLASARNNLGALLASTQRLDEAATQLADAIRLDPADADAHVNLSAVLLQQRRFGDAAGEARRAIELDARHADAHANLGVALAQLGDTRQAIQHLDEALRINPRHASARANREALLQR
jgi:tetratricopeptide (TPR) repeat protein